MSLKKYCALDLAILAIIGAITELGGSWILHIVLPAIPLFTAGLVIVIIAISRWGAIGIILAPFLALIAYLGAKYVAPPTNDMIEEGYNFPTLYWVNLGFYAGTIFLIPIFKKLKYERALDCFWKRLLCCIGIYIIGCITAGLIWGSWFGYNVFFVMMTTFMQQLMGLLITFLFLEVLYRQGVCDNVKNKIIRERKEQEEERKYYDSR